MRTRSERSGSFNPTTPRRRTESSVSQDGQITDPQKSLLKQWKAYFRKRDQSHTLMFYHYQLLDYCFRIVTVACCATGQVMAQQPAFLQQYPYLTAEYDAQTVAMFCTVVAAFALAVNSRLRCKERSRNHLSASTKWRALDTRVYDYFRIPPDNSRKREQEMKDLLYGYRDALSFSPTLPPSVKWPGCPECCWSRCLPECLKRCFETQDEACDPGDIPRERQTTTDAPEDEGLENFREDFDHLDCEMLLARYAQAEFTFQICDNLAEFYYTVSSVIGSLGGACAIMALMCRAMSFSGTAPSWVSLVGGLGNAGLMMLALSEGANGFDDKSQTLQHCRNEFGSLANKIYLALYFQPHVCAPQFATALDKEAGDLITHWLTQETLKKVLDIGKRCHRGAPGVKAKKVEAESDFRKVYPSYRPPSIPPFPEKGSGPAEDPLITIAEDGPVEANVDVFARMEGAQPAAA